MEKIATYFVLVYGFLLIAGGVIGFTQAKSKASLIAGSISGVVILASGIIMLQGAKLGTYLALVVSLALSVVFFMRWSKTRAFMPSGMMLILNEITFIIVVLSLVL
ncbi:MAG: TMEM14 family protein [Blastocatellia bacterium]|nr:TMEM14 family protein [Blastocatellia bacterium]MBL8196352.1 TMEM14 family protein [Blastocatellia bacterium]